MKLFKKSNGKPITAEARRKKSNQKLKELGITCLETLPVLESSSEIQLKSIDHICKRAIACLLSIQFACDIEDGQNYEQSKCLYLKLLEQYDVKDSLLAKERLLFSHNFSRQDVVDVVWTYEAYWAIVWALGFIETIEIPNNICDCQKAVAIVSECRKSCHFKNVEEILDMLDLYYRYHWACVEKRVRPETAIGDLNPEVVMERRRGLEWLIHKESDWNNIPLDT